MGFRYVFFDLDGTLTDPGIGITNSVMYSLKKMGIEEKDRTKLYKFIGPPLLESYMKFYGFNEKEAWQALEYYREYFGDKGLFENEVYPGIPALLTKLVNVGFKLIVATSKPTEYSLRILERFELIRFFDFVSGSSMDEKNSAKSEIIKYAIDRENIDSTEVLMIGDREHDILGAKKNGIMSGAVLYGYGNEKEFMNAGADRIFKSVEELGILTDWWGDDLEKNIHNGFKGGNGIC